MNTTVNQSKSLRPVVVFLVFLFAGWIAAWLVKNFLDAHHEQFKDEGLTFAYWLAAKLLIWVAPAIYFLKKRGNRFGELFAADRLRGSLLFGGAIAAVIVVINLVSKTFIFDKPLFSYDSLFPFLSAVVIAPFVEEIAFRGAVLDGFLEVFRFRWANLLTAVFFLLIHFPGWLFRGDFAARVFSQQALVILLLGLVFGLITRRSDSLAGAILAHGLNNLTA
ncbi:MAG: CPBP family intramembrane metalloprotease [Acidobacteria bacterium]|nr:CPBP family intramembrane metalloprotease [Acidobacteriota bacterium]